MAERLKLSQGWLSKMLTIAGLPKWAVAAFATPADIQLKVVYPLAQKIQQMTNEAAVSALKATQEAAADLSRRQAEARTRGASSVPAADVVRLLSEASVVGGKAEETISFDASNGRPALSVLSANRNGVSIRLHSGSGATEGELVTMLKSALRELEKQGRGLQA
jgi:ParB family chromosome partitioning protein